MSIQTYFKPNQKIERDYDKRAYLMVKGIKEGRPDLAGNSVDLKDYDKELAKQGEQ
jgi:hypothetical protein